MTKRISLGMILAAGTMLGTHSAHAAYCLTAGGCAASTAVQAAGGDISATVRKAAGETASRTVAAGLGDIYNIAEHGADGTAINDTAALNKAIAYAKIHSGTHIIAPMGTFPLQVSSQAGFALPSNTEFEGASQNGTFFTWNDTLNGDNLFTAAPNADGTRATDIALKNFTVVGTWGTAVAAVSGVTNAATAYALGNTAIEIAGVDHLTIENVSSRFSRGFGMGARDSTSVFVTNDYVFKSLSDGYNFDGCADITINGVKQVHGGDDFISIHNYLNDRWAVRRQITVINSQAYDTRAIDIASPVDALIANNHLYHWKQAAFSFANQAAGGTGQEGNSATNTLVLTGNLATNGVDNSAVDGSNSPAGATAFVFSGYSSRAGNLNATPGMPDTTNGVVVPVKPYYLANSQSTSVPVPVSMHIYASNNHAVQAEPATDGTIAGFSGYASLFAGPNSGLAGDESQIMSILGPQTPGTSSSYNTVGFTAANIRPNCVTFNGDLDDVWFTDNSCVGMNQVVNILGTATTSITRLHILRNNFSDFLTQGLIEYAPGHADFEFKHNNLDGDPLLQSQYRGTHGTWTNGSGPVGIQVQSGSATGGDFEDNTFKNLALDTYNVTFPLTPTNGMRFASNKVYADAPTVGSFSASNKGVGLVHGGSGFELVRQDSDPSDGTAFGSILSSQLTQAPAMPTTGTWQAGWIVWNSAPTATGPIGWLRLTNGTGSVAGTDWLVLVNGTTSSGSGGTTSGTISATSITNSGTTSLSGTVTASGAVNAATVTTTGQITSGDNINLTNGVAVALSNSPTATTNYLFANSNNNAQISASNSTYAGFEIGNFFAHSGVTYSVLSETASFTIAPYMHLFDATAASAATTGTLPACVAANAGQEFKIKKTDATASSVGFTASGSDLIDGATTAATTTQYAVISVVCSSTAGKWDRGF